MRKLHAWLIALPLPAAVWLGSGPTLPVPGVVDMELPLESWLPSPSVGEELF